MFATDAQDYVTVRFLSGVELTITGLSVNATIADLLVTLSQKEPLRLPLSAKYQLTSGGTALRTNMPLSHVCLREGVLCASVVVQALDLKFSSTYLHGAALGLRPMPEEQERDDEQDGDAFQRKTTGAELWAHIQKNHSRNYGYHIAFKDCDTDDLAELKSFLCTAESAQWREDDNSAWEKNLSTMMLVANVSGHKLTAWYRWACQRVAGHKAHNLKMPLCSSRVTL
jgi:hypothetical protein